MFFDDVAAFLTNLLRLTQLLDGPIGTEAADVKEQGIGQTQEFQMPVGGLDLGLGFGNQVNDLLGQWLGIQVLLMVEIGLEPKVGQIEIVTGLVATHANPIIGPGVLLIRLIEGDFIGL